MLALMAETDPPRSFSSTKRTSPIQRGESVTASERSLLELCDGTFLSLWSYPSVYRDQGRNGEGSDGKELADLLVVFGDDVIVFSDKDCAFGNSGDLVTDWQRWYKKSIEKSAKQAWGAERWIRDHPDALYLDRACTQPFPLDLPPPERMRVHHVLVAHGASARSKAIGGGSGSLSLTNVDTKPTPFLIGDLDRKKSFVHVLDDTTLGILLRTLDTAPDFVGYLKKKEELFRSDVQVLAAGEEELLAWYLTDVDEETGEHDFRIPSGQQTVVFDEGMWAAFSVSDEYRSKVLADQISYGWDRMIEEFSRHIQEGTYSIENDPAPARREQAVRRMAAEPRFRRRMLSEAFSEHLRKAPSGETDWRGVRVVQPEDPSLPTYVFLVVSPLSDGGADQYRKARLATLLAYCMSVKLDNPAAQEAVGIACATRDSEHQSEDVVCLDLREWTDEHQAKAEEFRRDLGLWKSPKVGRRVTTEYPAGRSWSRDPGSNPRNKPCYCGSGRKYKHCHGRAV